MRNFVSAVLITCMITSCGSKEVIAPETESSNPGEVFYKDAHVAIAGISGEKVNNGIRLKFSSLYERNVVKMELFSGPYENMLCFFHEEDIAANSSSEKKYAVTEQNAVSPERYYVIKYTLRSGGWVLTPAFKYNN